MNQYKYKTHIAISQMHAFETSEEAVQSSYDGESFPLFQLVTEAILKATILSGNSKCCHLDPVPNKVLKQTINDVIPVLRLLPKSINIYSPVHSSSFKSCMCNPTPEKEYIDNAELRNYRPVSNLAYVSKLIERMAMNQPREEMEECFAGTFSICIVCLE